MRGLFFQRQKRARGEYPTTFQYDQITPVLKNRIWLLWQECDYASSAISNIVHILRREIGTQRLFKITSHYDTVTCRSKELQGFFIKLDNFDYQLSIVELMCEVFANDHSYHHLIDHINRFMREEGLGYTYNWEEGIIVRIEDETFYENVTSSTLSILGQSQYSEAYKSYLGSYEELKKGELGKAIVDCCKALESLLKVKFKECGISYETPSKKEMTLAPLLNTMRKHIIAPPYMENSLNSLKEVMMAVATVRNNDGAHGSLEGLDPTIDERFVRYMINLTASNILFIAEADFSNEERT